MNKMNKDYNIKGRGYQTRGMYLTAGGELWIIPMYRNSDDAMLGSYEVSASATTPTTPRERFLQAHKAFEIVRKECWAEFSSSRY